MPWDNGAEGEGRGDPEKSASVKDAEQQPWEERCSEAEGEKPPAPSPWFPWFPSLMLWGPAMHRPAQESMGGRPDPPHARPLSKPPRGMCFNAKVTGPSVFEGVWEKSSTSLGRCRVPAPSVLGS